MRGFAHVTDCIDQWLGEHDECPLCKTKVSDSARESLSMLEATFSAMAGEHGPAEEREHRAADGDPSGLPAGTATSPQESTARPYDEDEGTIPDNLWDMDPELQAALVASMQGDRDPSDGRAPASSPPSSTAAAPSVTATAAGATDSPTYDPTDDWDPFGEIAERAPAADLPPSDDPPGVRRRAGQ